MLKTIDLLPPTPPHTPILDDPCDGSWSHEAGLNLSPKTNTMRKEEDLRENPEGTDT